MLEIQLLTKALVELRAELSRHEPGTIRAGETLLRLNLIQTLLIEAYAKQQKAAA